MKIDGVKLAVRLLGRCFVRKQNFVAGLFAGLTPVVIPGIRVIPLIFIMSSRSNGIIRYPCIA